MGEIEPWMDETFIMNSFIEFGFMPKRVNIILDKRPNHNHNFCFVTFSDSNEANNAMLKLNGKTIPGTKCFFKLNITKKNSQNKKIIFVSNLEDNIGDNELYKFFKSKYYSVISASVISDCGKSRGYGFVHFTDEDDFQNCLEEMNGKLLNNKKIIVKKKITIPKINNKYNNFDFMSFMPYNQLNILNTYNQENIITKPNLYIQGDSSTISNDKEQNSLSLNTNNNKAQNFLDNIKLIESNDNISLKQLNKKIQESFNTMLEYYKNNNKLNEIPKIILYYSSEKNI